MASIIGLKVPFLLQVKQLEIRKVPLSVTSEITTIRGPWIVDLSYHFVHPLIHH